MNLLISIPAYNEEATIAFVINEIKTALQNTKYSKYSILVLDDGSTDRTKEIAESLGAKVISHPANMGLAETFRSEMKYFLESKHDIFIHIDADGQYVAQDIPKLLKEIESGYSLVLGSRFLGTIEHMPLMKRWGNRIFSKAISRITKYKITDGQTGFRAFTKDVAKLDIISSHTYTQEQVIRAVRNKFRVKEVPVYARKTRRSKLMTSHPLLHVPEYAVKAWINIFRLYRDFEPLKFFGRIGTGFLGAGFVVGLFVFSDFILTGRVGHLPSAVLTMLLIVTGVQIWMLGFLADMWRK